MKASRSAPELAALTLRLIGAGLLVAGSLFFLHPAGAVAQETGGGFRLLARADVAAVAFTDPDAPAVPEGQVAYFSPGTTQAVIDSLGTSQAIASAPYPGDALANLPPTLNGVLAGNASLPDYPFIVTSSHPTVPSASREIGPYRLDAASAERASSGSSRLGITAGDAVLGLVESSSQVTTDSAVARTRVSGITVGDVLRIGELTAEASIRSGTRASALKIDGMTVAGVGVTIDEKGLHAGQTVVTAPGTAGIDEALRQAGISVRYLPATMSDTGVTSAALAITSTTAFPGRTPGSLAVTLGAVRVSSTTLPAGLPEFGTGDVGLLDPAPDAEIPSGSGAVAVETPAAPVLDSGQAAVPAGGGETELTTSAGTGPAPEQQQAAPGSPAPRRVTRVLSTPKADGRGFYLVFVATGAALVGGSRLVGALAVRLRRLPRPG